MVTLGTNSVVFPKKKKKKPMPTNKPLLKFGFAYLKSFCTLYTTRTGQQGFITQPKKEKEKRTRFYLVETAIY